MKKHEALREVHNIFEWDKWCDRIPFLNFKESWSIKVIPPYGVGIIRFLVKSGEAQVSVYLDCYDMAGSVQQPYWEIYPHSYDTFDDGETDGMWTCRRYFLDETEDLLDGIMQAIKNQKEHEKSNND